MNFGSDTLRAGFLAVASCLVTTGKEESHSVWWTLSVPTLTCTKEGPLDELKPANPEYVPIENDTEDGILPSMKI